MGGKRELRNNLTIFLELSVTRPWISLRMIPSSQGGHAPSESKSYLTQKMLPPNDNVGVKELGLIAFGSLVSTLLSVGRSLHLLPSLSPWTTTGDVAFCSQPFHQMYAVLKSLKGQQVSQSL